MHMLNPHCSVDRDPRGVVRLTIPQAADALGISSTTADRYWAYARAWLHAELKKDAPDRRG